MVSHMNMQVPSGTADCKFKSLQNMTISGVCRCQIGTSKGDQSFKYCKVRKFDAPFLSPLAQVTFCTNAIL